MATEHHFYMDTGASRHDLRDVLVRAGIGFEAWPDWERSSSALATDTDAGILDDLSFRLVRPDNGVVARCSVTFRDRRRYIHDPGRDAEEAWLGFETETVRGVMAFLRAYPEAGASWEAYDGHVPLLLRREGRLVLSRAAAAPGEYWDPAGSPCLPLVDLPYTVEPLGPWAEVETGAWKAGRRTGRG